VVTSGARVGAGATLLRSVVAGRVGVPPGSFLADALVVPEADGRPSTTSLTA
jgi:hypothetical protein